MAEARKRVLVVGGSGYLGQHLLQRFSRASGSERCDLAFTHHRPSPPAELVDAVSPVLPFRVDLRTGDGFDAISTAFGQPDVVVNCAALSVPRTCEMDPAAAMSINRPSSLVNWLQSFKDNNSLLIHLSTDQVYEGVRSFYKEDDEALPVNMYGKTKIAAEKHIIANCSNYAILRSSIIYGPQTISPVSKSLPIQWIDSVLKQGQEVEFFHDELRCPVYVKDVVDVIIALSKKWISDGKQMQLLLNVGGPNRVSRFQMAETVARIRGYNHSLIKSVSASSVNRGVISPADISMDISILIRGFTSILNSRLLFMFPLLPQRSDLRSSQSMRAIVPSIRDGRQELVGHLGIVQENPPPSPPSFQNAGRLPACSKEKIYLRNLFHRLRALISLNCSLILGTRYDTNSQPMPSVSLRRNMGSEFSCMIKEAKVLGTALGIPFLDGLEEAEAQCALLNVESLCDGCFSTDSDIFLFGARTVYRDIFLGEGSYVTCYEMEDIEQQLGFGRNSLESACRIVKSLGDDSVLHQIISEGLKIARVYKGRKKITKELRSNVNNENEHGNQQSVCGEFQKVPIAETQDAESDGQYLDVINAFLKPKCHSADSEAVKRICTQHPFQRVQLHHVCEKYFGWSPDRTDQYILPKIAERDLRQFANLRSISSELGARIPLHMMPVPCPVSAIVKLRKVQGQDYYEVSWQGIDGLGNSIVPADLIKSACPERIAEYMEKKAEVKQQNRRPRRSSKALVNQIDLQLQGLLLGIESQSKTLPETANRLPPPSAAPEVIDLCSPSPPLRTCRVAKCQKSIDMHVNVIDIHESDGDATPEHERKARELRLFIDSIREDLY
ncbi:RmlD substrate binding domain [Musa troglodytarum]|uniref:RmlD substrate binding domain n=1 Tax=Musa troglodytarum TaxID=320322 RepID=A0A9E7GMH6_9LILI|nr:RmlD substrate binding domain [Musa troglodytarum]